MAIKILVVEADPVLRELIRETLECISHDEVFEAGDALEARKLLSAYEMDIVLCDIDLPGESGLDLARFISETHGDSVVVMISGNDTLETSDKAIENGAFSYLVKPVSRGQLKISVSNAYQFHNHKRLIREQQNILLSKISDLVTAKHKLAESEEEFRSIFENMQEGFYRASPDGKLVMANPMAVRILGYDSFDEINGVEMTSFYQNPGDRETLLQKIEKESGVSAYELNIRKKDGSIAAILVNSHPRKDKNGTLLGLEGSILDITDKKNLETELTHARTLESIGRLAAGIAHEINTPIQFLGDNLHFIKDAFKDMNLVVRQFRDFPASAGQEKPDPKHIEEMEAALKELDPEFLEKEVPLAFTQAFEGIGRVRKIVMSMKEFSHPGGEDHVMTDINHAVENTVTVAGHEWKPVSDLKMDLDNTLPEICCHPGEINLVLLNMIINASQAITDVLKDRPDKKGTITIQTRNRDNHIEISISDTGSGIPEAVRDKIFEPFFTTKPVGKGTGQGLAVAHSIITDRHKGKISLESQPGKGTTFMIRLPKVPCAGKGK